MAPTVSSDPVFTNGDREILFQVASDSIRYGLDHDCPLPINPLDYPDRFGDPQATFVTLHRDNELRGCIGTLEPRDPLVTSIAVNAFQAAFRDPRFTPVQYSELDRISLDISVLSKPEALAFRNQEDLLGLLQPGRDGLILEEKALRGTFLPSVWKSIDDPLQFLQQLKRKTGLSTEYWSDTIRIYRYTTETFSQSGLTP